eukprot:15244-Heterococcus_DN1.PRE.2
MLGANTLPCKRFVPIILFSALCVSFAAVAAVLDWQGELEYIHNSAHRSCCGQLDSVLMLGASCCVVLLVYAYRKRR